MKVYRPAKPLLFLAMSGSAVSFLLGLSGVASYVQDPTGTGVSGLVVAGLLLVFGLWYATVIAMERLTVTEEGLIVRRYLRKRVISWSAVQAFKVGDSRSMVRWQVVVVDLDSEQCAVNATMGTRSYVERIAEELVEAWHSHLDDGNADSGNELQCHLPIIKA